jgi:hypothetical protein
MRPVRRPVNITIVGSGPQQGGLEALARTLGVGGIRFTGFVDQDSFRPVTLRLTCSSFRHSRISRMLRAAHPNIT